VLLKASMPSSSWICEPTATGKADHRMALLPAVDAADGLFDRLHRSALATSFSVFQAGYPEIGGADHWLS
jgi:hypothetical protein